MNCGTCKRDPRRMNSAISECSHVECPHRGRAWSDRPTAESLHKGPWPVNIDADPIPLDIELALGQYKSRSTT